MTAAIPPACCAGADHDKPCKGLHRISRADRGGIAVVDADAPIRCVGTVSDSLPFRHSDTVWGRRANTKPVLDPEHRGFVEPDANTDANADTGTEFLANPNTDGRRFQRGIHQ